MPDQYVVVLGVAQDAGYPQAGCKKQCCAAHYEGRQPAERVVSLGIVDKTANKLWMIEATPDFGSQWHDLSQRLEPQRPTPDGIFLTHAHIGHYSGLMHLGREVMGAAEVPVFAMPRMQEFISTNGPWSQLVSLKNIGLQGLSADSAIVLSPDLSITPFLVPHRDEFSETVGYRIEGRTRSIVFIPDIDKWEKWETSIESVIGSADVALLDATFYSNGEINRDMREVPHPFVEESIERFSMLPANERQKVHFIHFNHTNPLIWDSQARVATKNIGFRIAHDGQVIEL